MDEDRPDWRYFIHNGRRKDLQSSDTDLHVGNTKAGAAIQPLDKLVVPKGRKDTEWLANADTARTELAKVWEAFRDDLTRIPRRYGNTPVDV